jgi:hypothetical protein
MWLLVLDLLRAQSGSQGVRRTRPPIRHEQGAAGTAAQTCIATRLSCESPGLERRWRARENWSASRPAGESMLGCQLGRRGSLVGGTRCAVGRNLPRMSLSFALMAAINGPTGSSATLSHGL